MLLCVFSATSIRLVAYALAAAANVTGFATSVGWASRTSSAAGFRPAARGTTRFTPTQETTSSTAAPAPMTSEAESATTPASTAKPSRHVSTETAADLPAESRLSAAYGGADPSPVPPHPPQDR